MTTELTTYDLIVICSQVPAAHSLNHPAFADATRNPAAVYLASLGPGSRRTMMQALGTIGELFTGSTIHPAAVPWWELKYQHTQALRSQLAARYAPATANKMLAALRAVLKEAWRLGFMDAETYHRAIDVPPVKGETLPRGRAVTAGELTALFNTCAADPGPSGKRDAAILALLYGAGLRRSEVVALDVDDFDTDTGALTIRSGKGNKARVSYATNGASEALEDWLSMRGDEPGPLFVRILKGGHIAPGPARLTDQAVLITLAKRAKQAEVKAFSPHDLRRTFIGDLLDRGADISTVQRLAGHAHVSTTARYDRRGEITKRRAAEMLHIPYQRGT